MMHVGLFTNYIAIFFVSAVNFRQKLLGSANYLITSLSIFNPISY
jgi:hypothetical protein